MLTIDMFYMNGLVLTLVVSLIMLGIYVLVHLFSHILQDSSLKAAATNEFGQVIFNIFIFIFLLFAVRMVDEIITPAVVLYDPYASIDTSPNMELVTDFNVTPRDAGVALSDQTNNFECLYSKKGWDGNYSAHICVALSFLDRASWLCEDTMLEMTKLYNFLGAASSSKVTVTGVTVSPEPPWIIILELLKFQPFIGFQGEMTVLKGAFDTLSKSIISIKLQQFAFDLIAQVLFPVLLVGGIVMRSFIFTRKFGGFLIAAALSLYFIAPVVYIIGHRAMFESGNFVGVDYNLSITWVSAEIVPYADLMRDSDFEFIPDLSEAESISWLHPIKKIKALGNAGLEWYKNIGAFGDAYLLTHLKGESTLVKPNGMLHITSKILMISVIMPLMTLLAVLASIKALAPFFGGDASIAGLTHFL